MQRNIAILFFVLLSSIQALSIERIDITQGHIDPTPIANTSFLGDNSMSKELGKEIIEIINNDLQGTGLFRVINPSAYIETIKDLKHIPNFSAWRQINASALLTGKVHSVGEGKINVEYNLWDPYTQVSLKTHSYEGKESQWRRIAHIIADDIYKRLTGEDGYFNTKIVFIAESGSAKNRIKKLAIMDQDGANLKYLSDGRNLTLTPRFSPDNHQILYLAYINHRAKVHLRDLKSGKDKILGHFKGMTFAPRFSPDGKEAIMSASSRGNSDVILLDLLSMKSSKLTGGSYINTSPYFSPDGSRIVFISDRSGRSKLYVMNKDGSDQQRISFSDGSYFTPIWSPRGDYIAFTKKYEGKFYIGVMRPDGSGERMLTEGYLVGKPAWSPNGRVIIYTKTDRYSGDRAKTTLCTVDLTGNFERSLQLPVDASDANWSNPLN